jgi:hypothetical protein
LSYERKLFGLTPNFIVPFYTSNAATVHRSRLKFQIFFSGTVERIWIENERETPSEKLTGDDKKQLNKNGDDRNQSSQKRG